MEQGNIILTPLPQSDGQMKFRPALILKKMPQYNDYLVCGISSNLNQFIENFDTKICADNPDFKQSGLIKDSVIRLAYLAVLPQKNIVGSIGRISDSLLKTLQKNLANYITSEIQKRGKKK